MKLKPNQENAQIVIAYGTLLTAIAAVGALIFVGLQAGKFRESVQLQKGQAVIEQLAFELELCFH